MENVKTQKIYPYVGNIYETSRIGNFDHASPWKTAETAFNWINFEYPAYHGHVDWELTIVLDDCIVQKLNGEETLMTEGMACLVGPNDMHEFRYPNGVKNQYQGVCLLYRDRYMKKLLDLWSPDLYDRISNDRQPFYFTLSRSSIEKYTDILLSIQTFQNCNTPETEFQCNMVCSNILLKFLDHYRQGSNIPTTLKPFIQNINNPMITPEQLKEEQEKLPYSYSQLTRLFKKYMHCTITQYVNRAKLEYAKELLSTTDLSIIDITNELNFESPSYFHNLFKKHFGVTPASYRKT
ncbi:MAG: helix-turn-helix domain-containing protein [Clostridia bacterium]|nr:helix-turn-helix domain-containing protein [Clostridia bacterium]